MSEISEARLAELEGPLYCDVCGSPLQREACNHVRHCDKCFAALQAELTHVRQEREQAAQNVIAMTGKLIKAMEENKRLRDCADAMAERLEDAYSQMAAGCECYNWTEMKRAAGDYRAAFPRKEAIPREQMVPIYSVKKS